MTGMPSGEMPFLEHLEELRVRLMKALLGVAVGCVLGFWVVQRFHVVAFLKKPIEPYLAATGGKLTVNAPTEGVFIVFKLALVVGMLLASPVIIYQVWAFLSPALYAREKKILVPALLSGLLLFMVGAALGWAFVVPQALDVLMGFQGGDFAALITFQAYYDFVIQILLALGLSFELPLVLIILAAVGLVTPQSLNKFRRFAIVLSAIAGAFLSPGTDVISMIMMTVPLLLLYEIGVLGAAVVHRRRLRAARAAALVLLLLAGAAPRARAQQPPPPAPSDTLRRNQPPPAGGGVRADSSKNARVGLPSGPTRRFADPDSVMKALLQRPGYTPTRFRGDTAVIWADERRLRLEGHAATDRTGAVLEADTITYADRECLIDARGDPRLFDKGKVAVGEGIRYDTCRKRGVVLDAFTSFDAQGQTWFVRGNIAQDSSTTRLFATQANFTACDLPVPHYSFEARRIKWLSDTIFVARPVVMYIRDVPVLWLPFIFKNLTKRNNQRKSGILIPSAGLTDIYRPNSSYNRTIRNIGYYWAPNDYFDATLRLDWISRQSVTYGVATNYKILDRFLDGTFAVNRLQQPNGATTTNFSLNHRQSFSLSTKLEAELNYSTSTSVLLANAVDPRATTQRIISRVNFQKQLSWGSINLGGSRNQDVSTGRVDLNVPFQFTPKPISLGEGNTWRPTFSSSYARSTGIPLSTPLYLVRADGTVDTIPQTGISRTLQFTLGTPVTLKAISFDNTLTFNDNQQAGRQTLTPFNEGTGTPGDSVQVQGFTNSSFQTSLDWSTGVSLPGVFRGKWNLTPTVGIQNVAPGSFAIRNDRTNGAWVVQSKRFNFALGASPAFYGFFPGLFGFSRIRHSIAPTIVYSYSPSASVPEAYARAIAAPGQTPLLQAPSAQTISLGLAQIFEGKTRPAPGDSLGTNTKKVRLLSIQTSQLSYDFEQAKLAGRTGWTTQTINNSLLSDLLPGFNFNMTHDLWRGTVGYDTTRFSPYLTAVQANFSVSNRTVRNILAFLGLGSRPTGPDQGTGGYGPYGGSGGQGGYAVGMPVTAFQPRAGAQSFFGYGQGMPGGPGFNATVNYTLQRVRPIEGVTLPNQTQQNLGLNISFQPTAYWHAMWSTQFDFTGKRFVSQDIQLQRELHDFRATFRYSRTPGGNSQFYLSVAMIAIPELKYDFNRTSLER